MPTETDLYPIIRGAKWERARTFGPIIAPAEWDIEYETRTTATAALRKLAGNARPHFSCTYDQDERRSGRGLWREGSGGTNHDTVVALWPELAPVCRVHLADDRGEPMYAIENGLYWLGATAYPDARNLRALARHLRITADEAAEVDAYVNGPAGEHQPSEALRFMVKALRLPARWQAEADEALAVILAD